MRWKDFCTLSNINILGSDSLTSVHLPSLHQITMEILENRLKRASSVAISTDSWDSNGPYGKVVVIVFHYILHLNGKLQKFVDTLDYIPAPTSHTATMLETLIRSRVDERLLDDTMLSAIVTDNGRNFVAAAELITDNIRCISHTCQLALKELEEDTAVSLVIANIHSIVLSIRKKSALLHKLRSYQQKPLDPILPVKTRWNSTFDMVKRFLKIAPFIKQLFNNIDIEQGLKDLFPTHDDIKRLEMFINVAEDIVKLSTWAEGDFVTISGAAPYLFSILNKFSCRSIDTSILQEQFQFQAKEILKTKFAWLMTVPNAALMASALDPRYGHLEFLTGFEQNLIWDELEREAANLMLGISPIPGLPLMPCITRDDIQRQLLKLRVHFESNLAPLDTDPLEWWSNYRLGEPLLPLVQHLFAIPASSASAERAFSNSGFISGDGRENLNLLHVEQMAVIRSALKNPSDAQEIFAELHKRSEL
eukprot:TRINITY_DN3862_c0_g1_i2.p1 TRINITY_DN3862_c0_g1~~TRINITY_DN3862_c0_g1_i2.p1  ORF type:complete len:478 (+),score=53.82 TRINITY_DN3862_c0_g1_i2:1422-2855(+)